MRGLIAIDGVHGVGKSTLARALAQRLGCEAIAADDFLQRNRGLYVDAILIDDLRGRLNATLASVSAVILEGVCARAVVERLGLTATAFVYVKRLTPAGVPSDWQILDAENGEVAEPFYFRIWTVKSCITTHDIGQAPARTFCFSVRSRCSRRTTFYHGFSAIRPVASG